MNEWTRLNERIEIVNYEKLMVRWYELESSTNFVLYPWSISSLNWKKERKMEMFILIRLVRRLNFFFLGAKAHMIL